MDKNEYNLKLEEINRYVDQGNYEAAAAAADQIEWKRVRNVRTLCMVSEVYEAVDRFEESKELLLRAYRRSPVGRAILYRLVEVTIRLKQFDEAIEYYSEYVQAAPHDNNRFILKYKIYRGRGSSVDEQIEILKEYLDQEYNEKYAYELARLYQQADRIQECLATCDDLVLWFQSGHYVRKALELKKKYAALTPKQQDIYERELQREASGELGQEKQIVDTAPTSAAEDIMEDAARQIAETVKASVTDRSGAPEAEESPADQSKTDEPGNGEEDLDEPVEDPAVFDEQLNTYNTQELQTEVIKSMRQIVSGVGRRNLEDPDEEAVDEVIEASKKDQEEVAQRRNQTPRMNHQLKMPKTGGPLEAGKLSIDDILLSMGDKGDAVRQAVAKAGTAKKTQPAGVLSAVDEALLNMGVAPHSLPEQKGTQRRGLSDSMEEIRFPETAKLPEQESRELGEDAEESERENEFSPSVSQKEQETMSVREDRRQEKAQETAPAREDRRQEKVQETAPAREPEDAGDADAAEILAEAYEEMDGETKTEADAGPKMSMDDIINARTRRIPTEEIQQRLREAEQGGGAEREAEPEEVRPVRQGRRVMLRPAVRGLFQGFTDVQDMEMQIAFALKQALAKGKDRTSRTGNILIFGSHGSGKTTIATALAKAIAQEQGREFVKMAKIYATDLNRKDIAATIAKIAGGILIIEEAGDMEDSIADQLTTAMEFRTDGLIIIMEDEQRYVHELLMRHPRMTMKFTAQIYIPDFSLDDLVNFGQLIAQESDCTLSRESADALAARIEALEKSGEEMSLINVRELTQAAVKRADKFSRRLFGGKKRFDEEGRVILQAKDFR